MEIKGRVIQSLGVQKGTSKAGKEWSKASVIIETDGQYPKKVALDNMKNAEEFGKLPVGSTGVFHIEVESREFNGGWYTNVNCWKWEMDQAQPSAQQPQSSHDDSCISSLLYDFWVQEVRFRIVRYLTVRLRTLPV